MRKIMILGASALQVPGIIQAKKMGLYVIAVDMNPNAVGFKYADKAVVISTIDIPKVVEAAKIMKVDGVITLCTDMPVRTVAAVAEVLGLPAISVDNAYRATDKIKMRETLKECGVPIPYFTMAKNENEFITAVQEVRNLNYKCIVKPADNSGSHGVVLLDRFDIAYLKDVYSYSRFNPKEGLIPRSLLRNKLMTNEVSLGLIPRSLLRGVSFPVQEM